MSARESRPAGNRAAEALAGGEAQPNGSPPQCPGQGSLDDALDRALAFRDQGAENALLSAHTYWRIAAENVVADLAAGGQTFSIENVYARVGQPPGHLNAAGGLLLRAAKAGTIRPVGYRQSTRPERRGSVVRVWVGAA